MFQACSSPILYEMLSDLRMTNTYELQELIDALKAHLQKVRELGAWLSLKKQEIRGDDYISFQGYMQAQEQYETEISLLSGHAFLIQSILAAKKRKPDDELRRLLNDIQSSTSS